MSKRLIRKAMNRTLYHATTSEHFLAIMNSGGIYPSSELGYNNYASNNIDGGVYLGSLSVAEGYAEEMIDRIAPLDFKKPMISSIIEVYVDDSNLIADENGFYDNVNDWKGSLETTGAVVHMGEIHTGRINRVKFLSQRVSLKNEEIQNDISEMPAIAEYVDFDEFIDIYQAKRMIENLQSDPIYRY